MNVIIKNFQSIGSVELDAAGFTVITGVSNVGKSAIIRAIKAAIFGLPGDFFIQDRPVQQDQCGVSIELSGKALKWRKVRDGKASPSLITSLELTVDGKTERFTKYGRDHLEISGKALGFEEYDIGGRSGLVPQIASQFDPIFLVFNSETEAATLLNIIGRADIITEAQRLATKDLRELTGRVKVRQEDLASAEEAFHNVQWVPGVRSEYDDLAESWVSARRTIDQMDQIVKKVHEIQNTEGPIELPESPKISVPGPSLKCLALMGLMPRFVELPESPKISVPGPSLKCLSLINLLQSVKKELEHTRDTLLHHAGVIDELERDKIRVESELGKCPMCGKTFETAGPGSGHGCSEQVSTNVDGLEFV